ncbi:MAG: hypothetical protein R3F44_13235 [Candidatus Competibacteraceae bacterium]
MLRPVLPEDEPSLQALVSRASPEDLRLRFFQPIRELSHQMAAALTQIDYHREMALRRSGLPDCPVRRRFTGSSTSADPNGERAEYSIIVDRAMMRLGLATLLDAAHHRLCAGAALAKSYGEVLQGNKPMLQLTARWVSPSIPITMIPA